MEEVVLANVFCHASENWEAICQHMDHTAASVPQSHRDSRWKYRIKGTACYQSSLDRLLFESYLRCKCNSSISLEALYSMRPANHLPDCFLTQVLYSWDSSSLSFAGSLTASDSLFTPGQINSNPSFNKHVWCYWWSHLAFRYENNFLLSPRFRFYKSQALVDKAFWLKGGNTDLGGILICHILVFIS